MFRIFSGVCAGLALTACSVDDAARNTDRAPRFELVVSPDDPLGPQMTAVLAQAYDDVENFWASVPGEVGYRRSFTLTLAYERAAFDAALPAEWGIESQCWMVGLGIADRMVYLSPSVWEEVACEHDAADAAHIREIAMHELMHVYHGQHHPIGDFTGSEELSWFIEGIAVFGAGQLNAERMARARADIEAGQPDTLVNAWRGPNRYAIAGSMAAYIDAACGRAHLWSMLPLTTQAEALDALGMSEAEFLQAWRAWVLQTDFS